MSTTQPRIISTPIKNGAYGFPRGVKRTNTQRAIIVVHISGNKNTASKGDTLGEIAYMGRPIEPDGHYNSAHNYIARDGTVYQTVPMGYAAWNNGELLRPNIAIKSVADIVGWEKKGVNPNQLCYREVECTGYPGSFPVTQQQLDSIAWLIAKDSIKIGLPINRNTVLTHADLDSVNRANCAFPPGKREAILADLIAHAIEIKADLNDSDPIEEPPPAEDPCAEAKAALDVASDRVTDLTDENLALQAALEASQLEANKIPQYIIELATTTAKLSTTQYALDRLNVNRAKAVLNAQGLRVNLTNLERNLGN